MIRRLIKLYKRKILWQRLRSFVWKLLGVSDPHKRNVLLPFNGYHSQFGQDYFVFNIVGHKKKGYFVDVGARCGTKLSNTLYLERNGWEGICIEPHPDLFVLAQRDRACHVVNCAISDVAQSDIEFIKLMEGPLGRSGIVDSIRNVEGLKALEHEIISVRTERLDSVLQAHDAPSFIEYLDVDVEGHELKVLQSINFDRYEFGTIGVEARPDLDRSLFAEICQFLSDKGYAAYAQIGSDTFFTKA